MKTIFDLIPILNRYKSYIIFTIIFPMIFFGAVSYYTNNIQQIDTVWVEGDIEYLKVSIDTRLGDKVFGQIYSSDDTIIMYDLLISNFDIVVIVNGSQYSDTISSVANMIVSKEIGGVLVYIERISENLEKITSEEYLIILIVTMSIFVGFVTYTQIKR